MLQRRLDLPDATVLVLQGIAFVLILASETLYGRFTLFRPREAEPEPWTGRARLVGRARSPCWAAPSASARRSCS